MAAASLKFETVTACAGLCQERPQGLEAQLWSQAVARARRGRPVPARGFDRQGGRGCTAPTMAGDRKLQLCSVRSLTRSSGKGFGRKGLEQRRPKAHLAVAE